VRTPSDVLVSGEINQRMFNPFIARDVLFTLDGDAHMARRRLLLPFFQEQHALHYTSTLTRLTKKMIDGWAIKKPFSLLPDLQKLSFDMIMETIFGLDTSLQKQPIVDLLHRVAVDIYASPLLALRMLQIDAGRHSPWGKRIRLNQEMCRMLDDEIQNRRKCADLNERKDILSQLLLLQSKHADVLTDRVIRDEVLVLLAAGFNATVFILCWTIECAWSYPDVLQRIRAELDEAANHSEIELARSARLPYLDAVINESIRHRMPSPMAGLRLAKSPTSLLGYDVPEGAFVSMCLAGLGMQSNVFSDPRRYRPERFLERTFSAFEWNPFGSGTRQCVGRGLGQIELRIILSKILARTDFRLLDENRKRERRGMFLVPRHGLRVQVDKRR
jgi:cytochrome P450 family 110